MDGCPPLEDIAAFLDGKLSLEERERVTEHLARCEICYEVFAGAVHFQEDSAAEDTGGRGVLPFPLGGKEDQAPRRIPRWLPLAASVLLAAGLGFFAWQFFAVPRKMELADLTEPLQRKPELTGLLYEGQTVRGEQASEDSPQDAKAFLASVYLVDLHLAVGAEDTQRSAEALRCIGAEIKQIPFSGGEGEKYQKEAMNLESQDGLREFSRKLPDEEKNIREILSLNEPFYSFGLWTEAGRLAAKVEAPEFFERRKNRHFLSYLQKILPNQLAPELQEPVLNDLRAIERIWDQGALSPQDYPELARHFQNIIERIEEYRDNLGSEDLEESVPKTDSGAE